MKKIAFTLISVALFSLNSVAIADIGVGCYDSVIVLQADIHAESGKPSSQTAHINQEQSPNCSGNININTISQTHLGFDGASQTVIGVRDFSRFKLLINKIMHTI